MLKRLVEAGQFSVRANGLVETFAERLAPSVRDDYVEPDPAEPEPSAPGGAPARHDDEDADRLSAQLLPHGMQARFRLPHAGGVGVFASRSRQSLERASQVDDLSARCIDRDPR